MSYCRFLEADVYVFMHVGNFLTCSACFMSEDAWGSFDADSTQKMVDHLNEHVAQGHYVPQHVFDDLWADDAENFPREV